MFFCAVAGWFIDQKKCDRIAQVMDNRLDGKQMPFGVTKTLWTQKRCLQCRHRLDALSDGPEKAEE